MSVLGEVVRSVSSKESLISSAAEFLIKALRGPHMGHRPLSFEFWIMSHKGPQKMIMVLKMVIKSSS